MLSTVRDSQQKLLSKGALVFIFYLCLVNHSRPLMLRLANHLAHIRESETVLDSGLHTLDSGCFVSPFQLFVLPHSLIPQANISRILDSKGKNFLDRGVRIPLHGPNTKNLKLGPRSRQLRDWQKISTNFAISFFMHTFFRLQMCDYQVYIIKWPLGSRME